MKQMGWGGGQEETCQKSTIQEIWKNNQKFEQSLRSLCDVIKPQHLQNRSPRKRKEVERIFEEIMAQNFTNMVKK